MNLLKRSFSLLRTWLGLSDPSDDRLTPGHGWLLPPSDVAVVVREEAAPRTRVPLP